MKRAAQAVLLTAPEHASIAKPGVPQLAAMAFGLWRPLVERDAPKFNAALAVPPGGLCTRPPEVGERRQR